MKQIKMSFAVLFVICFIGVFLSYRCSKSEAEVFLSPIRDLLLQFSSSFHILGTDRKSPSFCFFYHPKWTDNHYATFCVETSVLGNIKSFSGPFVNGSLYSLSAVRSNLLENAQGKELGTYLDKRANSEAKTENVQRGE